ncbi:MAG: XAC2610-related protein [Psychrobacter sp.]|uniref:XAC2610-related protein n=1 Tax=Psychrobacter sp. AOP7-B1-24 TaxID=3457645 RepID=UPI003FB96DF5
MILICNKPFKKTALLSGLLVSPLLSYSALAQTYQIQDFSDDYYAVIEEIDGNDYGDEANKIVKIIDEKTHKILISQPASIDIKYELSNSEEHQLGEKISANIVSIPYGEHSVLIYDDFNFDGQKDLAIKDGRNSCYGGPSYQVYLKDGNTFVYSQGFTELAQNYCGFFGFNKTTKTLDTMSKSGAAWHEYSKYKVIDNQPVAVHVLVEEYNSKGLISITESTRVNGEMVEDSYEMLPEYDDESHDGTLPFVYKLDLDNGKKMVLNNTYNEEGEQMYYAFADKNDRIELYYDGQFVYDTAKKTLSFLNKPVVYQINKQGITVRQSNKSVLLKSVPQSEQGSLENLGQFNNVSIK